MAGFDKRVASYEEAMEGIESGMTVLAGGKKSGCLKGYVPSH